MKKELKIVIDTSIFINPDAHRFFGNNPLSALNAILNKIKEKSDISCYIPPTVYEELMKLLENPQQLSETTVIIKKPPSSYEDSIPALLFYEFIEDMRLRINKGLRTAEKYTRRALKETNEDEIIKSLREAYRAALREGTVDSKEDFDLILLAKELNAYLATADKGLIKWAGKLGITCISAKELKEVLA